MVRGTGLQYRQRLNRVRLRGLRLPDDPLRHGSVTRDAVHLLPMILLSPVGGVLADRFDRRLMMLLGDGGSALGLIYILIVMFSGEAQLWQLCVGVTISSIFASLTDPAYKATITDLLPEEQFAKASGLVQLAAPPNIYFHLSLRACCLLWWISRHF